MTEIDTTIPKPESEPTPESHHLAHTYKDDLARAMDATDATVVQKMMKEARDRETIEHDNIVRSKQRGWYVTASFILVVLALGAVVYGFYYYKHLTVKVTKQYSVGIFPTTEAILTSSTDIRSVITKLTTGTDLPENKPTLVTLTSNASTLAPLTNEQFFQFIEANATEPFQNTIAIARLGVMNTDNEGVPFIIFNIKDPEIAGKEFLIAEPDILKMFYSALNIDISQYSEEIGKGFESTYLYNLPVRVLSSPDTTVAKGQTVLFYASVTDNIIVVTTSPTVLKAIYENVIKQ